MKAEAGAAPRIGIALSGGGSRAMAFHLGCLRTLHRTGVLQQARVMSAVSGGSVIAAMYAVHEGDFDDFEQTASAVLRAGFGRAAVRTALTTAEGPRAVVSFGLLLTTWLWLLPIRAAMRLAALLLTSPGHGQPSPASKKWMPRRFASRTTILQRTFDELLFKGRTLGNLPTGKPKLVTLAAELRTGSAFYFSSAETGSWRVGKLDPTRVLLSQAVAASAAYPLLLPALDEVVSVRKADGLLRNERVTLTDGGVYENLGLSPLWPDRDRRVSVAVEDVDTIIACRAGYGLRTEEPSLFWPARMSAAFGCVFARAQNLSMSRLFDLKAAGRLRAFALPYLDQDDERLACAPPDLVRRSDVAGYPTNFSAMPQDWIDRLSKRGEQVTLAVLREHTPELLGHTSGS